MKASDVLNRRVRGFRVIDLAALVLFLALALAVYAFKTAAGSQRADIAEIETQIQDETRDVRLLRAKVASLESASRVEDLATRYANQAPVTARQEIEPGDLARVADSGAAQDPVADPAAANSLQAAATR
ncbi:MAG TPA: cell division protein [Caulobacteraceae bacterium]|nr:cell division protein [Caulobacteraceae bacterium]